MTNPILAAARKPKAAIQKEGDHSLSGQPYSVSTNSAADSPANEPLEATSAIPEPIEPPTTHTEAAEVPANDPCEIQADKGELVEMLKGCKLADHAVDVAAVVKMPRDTAILCALSIASAAVVMRYRTEYRDGGEIPLGLYVACEQPPSTGKSSVMKRLQAPIFTACKQLRAKDANPDFSGFLSDATPEGLESSLHASGGGFMLASTEQAIINSLLGLSYNGNGKSNNAIILEGYSGDYHSSARITRKGYVGNVFGSVTVISQNGTIDSILSASNGTGITERFIMFSEPDLLGMRDHTKEHLLDDQLSARYSAAIAGVFDPLIKRSAEDRTQKALEKGLMKALIAAGDDDDLKKKIQKDIEELFVPLRPLEDLEVIHITAASWDRINQEKNVIEQLMKSGGRYDGDTMRSYAGKLDQRVAKIAGTLHVIESLMDGREVSPNIEHRFIEMAIKVSTWANEQLYCVATAKGYMGRPAEHEAIIRVLSNKGRPLLWRDIQQACKPLAIFKNSRNTTEAIRNALTALCESGIVTTAKESRGAKNVTTFLLC